jgi:hypothetical protein
MTLKRITDSNHINVSAGWWHDLGMRVEPGIIVQAARRCHRIDGDDDLVGITKRSVIAFDTVVGVADALEGAQQMEL